MKIEKNKVVSFHYGLSSMDSDFSESSGEQPMAYLHGHRNILPAMERALEGREAGETLSLSLSPEDAYGPRRPTAVQRVPIKHVSPQKNLKPGMVVKVHTDRGSRDATVIKVGRFNVDLDTNHPLAGQHLQFEIEIVEVRDASAEELTHGHAHGVGGHHH